MGALLCLALKKIFGLNGPTIPGTCTTVDCVELMWMLMMTFYSSPHMLFPLNFTTPSFLHHHLLMANKAVLLLCKISKICFYIFGGLIYDGIGRLCLNFSLQICFVEHNDGNISAQHALGHRTGWGNSSRSFDNMCSCALFLYGF